MGRHKGSITTWRDAQRAAHDGGGKCVRQNGDHQVWVFPQGQHLTLCNKGNEQIKAGLRHHIIACFVRWGILCLVLGILAWQWLA